MAPAGSTPDKGIELSKVPTQLSAEENTLADSEKEKGGSVPMSSSSNTTSDKKSPNKKSAGEKATVAGAEISPSESADSSELDAVLKELPEDERRVIQAQLDSPTVQVNYFSLYRYATTNDFVIIAISIVCAIAGGAALPLFTVRKPQYQSVVQFDTC
jgi:ATP-binding cassette, subfamily B (MDR/TAP), member 1